MRHLWRVRSNLSESEWKIELGPLHKRYDFNQPYGAQRHPHQWVLTTDKTLAEPVVPVRASAPGNKVR